MPGNINISPNDIAQWPAPNYVNPVERNWLPAFSIAWMVATTVVVAARFYVRAMMRAGNFGLDDVFIGLAWLLAIGFTVTACVSAMHYGVNRHTWDTRPNLWWRAVMWAWIAQFTQVSSTAATKISVLLFYRRMVANTITRRWRVVIYAGLAFHIVTYIGMVILLMVGCRPLYSYWMAFAIGKWNKPYSCVPGVILNPIIGTIGAVTDAYVVILPCAIVHYYDLGMSRSQKIGLDCIFALGLLVLGAGIGKTVFNVQLGYTIDTSWTGFNLFVASIIECDLAIMVASVPSLRAYFRKLFARPSPGPHARPNQSTHGLSSFSSVRKDVEDAEMLELMGPSFERTGTQRSRDWLSQQPSSNEYISASRSASAPSSCKAISGTGPSSALSSSHASMGNTSGGSVRESI